MHYTVFHFMGFDTAFLLLPFWDILKTIYNQRILKHCRQQLDYVNTKNTTSLLGESCTMHWPSATSPNTAVEVANHVSFVPSKRVRQLAVWISYDF